MEGSSESEEDEEIVKGTDTNTDNKENTESPQKNKHDDTDKR